LQNDTANRLGWKNLNQCEVFTSFVHELSLCIFVARSFFPRAEVFPQDFQTTASVLVCRVTSEEEQQLKRMHLNKSSLISSWLSLASRDDTNTAYSTPRPAATILGVMAKSGTKPCPFQEGGNFCNMRSFGHIRAEAAVPAPQQPARSCCWWIRDFPKTNPSSK